MPILADIKSEIATGKSGMYVVRDTDNQLCLKLINQGLSDADITSLGELCQGNIVKELDIERNNLTSQGAIEITKKFPALKILILKQNSVGEKAVPALLEMKSLVKLDLTNNYLNEAAIKNLKEKFKAIELLTADNPGTNNSNSFTLNTGFLTSLDLSKSTEVQVTENSSSYNPTLWTTTQPAPVIPNKKSLVFDNESKEKPQQNDSANPHQ